MKLVPPTLPAWSRRRFASQVGVASAVAGFAPQVLYADVNADPSASQSAAERALARINVLARDTLAAVSSFTVPGNDPYSVAQGVVSPEAGGRAAQNDAFLVFMFNNYLPLPVPLGTLANAGWPLSAIELPCDNGCTLTVADLLGQTLGTLDSMPLSLVVALLLNTLALQVNPSRAAGPLGSPFARLTWQEKAEVFQRLEDPSAELLALLGAILPRTPPATLAAYLQLLAVGLLVFSAFGSYSEWAVLRPRTRTLKSRPIGWALAEYQPFGPVEGWDDFRGYYRDQRSATHA